MEITQDDLKPLKKAYNKAIEEKKEQFTYRGETILVSYAKYLIEYLEM